MDGKKNISHETMDGTKLKIFFSLQEVPNPNESRIQDSFY